MKPKVHTARTSENGQQQNVRDINDTQFDVLYDMANEDGEMGFVDDMNTEDETNTQEYIEDLRIESLKRAIDIAKLMSNVTPEDIISLAEKLVTFIRDTNI